MKRYRIGILLLISALMLLPLTGCTRNRDKNNTTTTDSGSPLVPSPGSTLPGEDGETTPHMTETTRPTEGGTTESTTGNETTAQESTTKQQTTTTTKNETTTKQETTTTKNETTTTKNETTTTKNETTTTKNETTTTKQETTTTKPETTTTKPETTTTKQETTTTKSETTTTQTPESTTSARETNEPPAPIVTPGPDMTDPIMPGESSTSGTSGSGTTAPESTSAPMGGSSETTVPESSAGEWLHFEAFEDDHTGAVAYLGRSAEELSVTDIIEYLHLPLDAEDITVIDRGDSEDGDSDAWYLILPRYRDTVVRLHEAEQVTRRRTRAGELIAEGMHPMLVRCDPEDGEPSIYVELIRGEENISFPLTAGNGNIEITFHDRVLNITPKTSARNKR